MMWLKILTVIIFISFLVPVGINMIYIIKYNYKRKKWEEDVVGDKELKRRVKRVVVLFFLLIVVMFLVFFLNHFFNLS